MISARETECLGLLLTENKHEQKTSQVAGGRWLKTGRQVTVDMCADNLGH